MRFCGARAALSLVAWLSCAVAGLTAVPIVHANNVDGAWSPVKQWPMIPVHALLVPDGRVLTYGTLGNSIYDVWDPAAGLDGGHLTLPNDTGANIFCSAQVVLPNGNEVFIAGGGSTDNPNIESSLFNYQSNSLTRQQDLIRPRYYASVTTLLDGETYVQGGVGGDVHPEIRDQNGSFRLLQNVDTSDFVASYSRNFVAPDGRIFGIDRAGAMYYIDVSGSGSVAKMGKLSGPNGGDSSSAMYLPGRILQFGGNSNGARIIDIRSGNAVVTATQTLSSQRRWVNATILADGKVLATGGSRVKNELTDVNYSAEIWDPISGNWKRGASGAVARLYHSTALLLPDASVLVAGGGNPGPLFNDNAEIYYPPYLYDAAGALAQRPVVASAPSFLEIGQGFSVDLAGTADIRRVTLVKTGSVTHGVNMEQRFVELAFQQSGNRLTIQSPAKAVDAPPGYYLLFAINSAGTPSVARIMRMGIAGVSPPLPKPQLDDPGDQVGQVGALSTLQVTASNPNGVTLTFGATGLPPGLTIDANSGLISGQPTATGVYNVTVTVTDGSGSDSQAFGWTISQAPLTFTLFPPASPSPAIAGSRVDLEASVSGGTDLQFKWDFDDGTLETAYSTSPLISHVFANPGIYYVTLTAIDAAGIPQVATVVVTIHLPLTPNRPSVSTSLLVEDQSTDRLWVVNQDNDSVSVFDAGSNVKIKEIAVGDSPRTLAIAPDGRIWVTNKRGSSISVISPSTLAVEQTIDLPYASQPFGVVASPAESYMYVTLEAAGRLLMLDGISGTVIASRDVGPNPRHISVSSDGSLVFVSRFITPPLPGESTRTVLTQTGGNDHGGEIVVLNGLSLAVTKTITLENSEKPDFENQGRGVPNYLGAMSISPDGQSAWVPSKQDNVKRGALRDGTGLTFQNTVRAISSRIDLTTNLEDYPARVDHDNSGVATAIVHDRLGVYMFVALETSREVAVVDAHGGWEIFRINVGRAPQGLALSVDGRTLYVSNFMDRSISIFDLSNLLDEGIANVPLVATKSTVGSEKMSGQVLLGKQLFYDAKDTRLARDGYLSCASCHNDGGHDGRVWDLTGFGEGLRNTITLRGRAGSQGFLHWSNNFDEVQDFEGQIRALSGGSGLMTNAQFNTGTRSQPLGDKKAGVSSDLDALASYVASLDTFAPSPFRNSDGSLTAEGAAGRALFESKNCGSCHGGTPFTNSASSNPQDIGTITSDSGKRLGGPLTGVDIPTLRDVWATAPYLHLGSASTLYDAVRAHTNVVVTDSELSDLVAYLQQIGSEETEAPYAPPPPPPAPPPSTTPNTGTGLRGQYFNDKSFGGGAVLERVEAVSFGWSTNAPGPGVNADNFSVRWTGQVEGITTGNYTFQTKSNDGVRLWVNGLLVIDNWTNHATATDNSPVIALSKNQRYDIKMEFYDNTGAAVARLKWKKPGTSTFAAVPAKRLYAN